MNLSGKHVELIMDAILDGYRSRSQLAIMVRVRLDENLDAIASAQNLKDTVFNLIDWAEAMGRLEDLVHAAVADNPQNARLQHLQTVFSQWERPQHLNERQNAVSSVNDEPFDIFISSVPEDIQHSRRISNSLMDAEFKVHSLQSFDYEYGSAYWQNAASQSIRQASCVLFILSPNARSSKWMDYEINVTVENDKPIFPLIVDGSIDDALPRALAHIQAAQVQVEYEETMSRDVIPVIRHRLGVSRATVSQYAETRGGNRQLNEAKLILVGNGMVGKTSLVKKLVHNDFDEYEPQTEGIQITKWQMTTPQYESERLRLHIWDFGGQEILHATHQFFLTQDSLYLLVLNGRQGHEDDDAEYWLGLIKSFGGNSPVIIVLNKISEYPFSVNQRNLLQKYSAITGFIETDCKTGLGIEELIRKVKREVNRLEYLRTTLPATWFEIKDRLSEMTDDYVTFESYKKICLGYGEKDTSAQKDLISYLHRLGIVLNYGDDPRLQDTSVLNPEWVTRGIYAIINAAKLMRTNGEICLADLGNILDPHTYPPERHLFLLDLMYKFELSFRLSDRDECYLIPELLDNQQPVTASQFAPEQCMNFQYRYQVLLEGILPRFIVRSYVLSVKQSRWRTGVILEFEDNQALVSIDKHDRIVNISVAGPPSGRSRLLAIIRSDFSYIHRSFSTTVDPREMVPLPKYPHFALPYKDLQALEKDGRDKHVIIIDDQVVEVDVTEVLNGVDLVDGTKEQGDKMTNRRPLRLFYSYSHKDEELRNELETHLKLLQRQKLIATWSDRRIVPGQDWGTEISDALERADLILLLISADFIASDYCYDIEMTRALELHNKNSSRIIPVIVRDVDWNGAPFAKLQALPKDAKAITIWDNRDSAWRDVSQGIRKAIEDIWSIS